jgi:hypothetical protein
MSENTNTPSAEEIRLFMDLGHNGPQPTDKDQVARTKAEPRERLYGHSYAGWKNS